LPEYEKEKDRHCGPDADVDDHFDREFFSFHFAGRLGQEQKYEPPDYEEYAPQQVDDEYPRGELNEHDRKVLASILREREFDSARLEPNAGTFCCTAGFLLRPSSVLLSRRASTFSDRIEPDCDARRA
jgi:hypothetical protein